MHTSDAFKAAIKKSHVAVIKCEVYRSGAYMRDLDIIDGTVTIDDQPIRSRLSVGLTDPTGELVPEEAASLLGVVDTELKVYRGIRFPDGTEELVPLGVFGIAETVIDDSGEGLHIRCTGYDRARKVIRAKMTNEYTIAAGTNYVTAIQSLLSFRYPEIVFAPTFMTTSATTPQIVLTTGDDPWAKAQKMALEGLGADLYFDMNGECTCLPVPDPTTTPSSWHYAEGSEAMILYINRVLTNEETFNHIIVTAENPERSTPLRGEALDDNPSSPTYYGGSYGDVVDWIFTELAPANATQTTVNEIASSILQKRLGFVDLVRFNSIVNPAHHLGDVITITREPSKLSSTVHVIDKITIPLVIERPMDIATKKRRV